MSFCKWCGNKLPDAARFCPACGKPQDNSAPVIDESSTKKAPSFDGLFGSLKKMASNAYDLAQRTMAFEGAKESYAEAMSRGLVEAEESDIDVTLTFAVDEGDCTELFTDWTRFALVEEDAACLAEAPEVAEIYRRLVVPAMNEVKKCEQYHWFEDALNADRDKSIEKMANVFFRELLNENHRRVSAELSAVTTVDCVLDRVGLDGFYSPRIMTYLLEDKYYSLKKFPEGIRRYDAQHIAEVRRWNIRQTIEEIIKEYGLTTGVNILTCHLYDEDDADSRVPIRLFKENGNLHILLKDTARITSRDQLADTRDYIEKIFRLDQISWFKEEGEYRRDLQITGGGTNPLLSHSRLYKGDYTDPIKTRYVETDTRHITMRFTDLQTIELTLDSLDTLRRLIPEKEYDIVEEARKNRLIRTGQ